MAERDIIINLAVKGVDQANASLEKFSQTNGEVNAELQQTINEIKQIKEDLLNFKKAQEQTNKSSVGLKGRLRELQKELQQLAIEGKQNTQRYRELIDEAGNLKDAISDVSDEISQAGSDTKGFDKVIRVASTATAAFGLVEGAAALFGDENEELQKSLLKVNAAMTVLTSLQQIQEELTRKDSLFTAAAAKAKAAYAAATAGATGALGAFRVALIATGIGAAVVAIGLLISNWDKLRDAIFGASNALDDYNKQREIDQKKSKAQSDINNAEIATLEAKARLLRSEGKIAEATLTDQAVLNAKVREAERLLNEEKDNQIKLEEKLAPAIAKRTQEIKRQIVAAENNTESFRGNTKSVAQLEKELRNVSQTIRNEYKPEIDEANIALEAAQTTYDNAKASLNEYNNELTKTKDKTKEAKKEIEAQAGSIAFLNAQIQKLTELQSKTADVTQIAKYQQQIDDLQARIEILNREIALFISFQNRVSENAEANFAPIITEVERVKTDAQLAAEAYDKLPQAIKDANAELAKNPPPSTFALAKSPEQIKAERQKEIQDNIQQAQIIADGTLAVFRQAQAARQQILDNRLKQGLITEQEYQEEVAKLRRKQAVADKLQAVFNATLSGIQAYLAALKFGPVFAGVVAALAAAQLAAIAATPIPKFRKGGDVDILKGGRERLGQLFGNSHEQGGILIEAEGGEHITRKSMAKKYRPLLHAINSDTVDSFLKPNAIALPMPKRLSNSDVKSSRQAEKRMAELIEEVRFLSQYVRQGNKYAKVTADNTQDLKTAKKYHRV